MPTPCGLGLKFTVGTAVSVSPLGQEVKRQRRINQGGPRRRRRKGRRERTFKFFIFYIRDIINKNLSILSPTFLTGSGTRRNMTYYIVRHFHVACAPIPKLSACSCLHTLEIKSKNHATTLRMQ